MKVLQVNKLYYPWIGGVEQQVRLLAEGLQKKFDVEVLTCQAKGKGIREEVNGVKVTRAGSIGLYWGMPVSFSFPFLLRKRAKTVDIIHLHSPFPLGELACLWNEFRDKKIVVTYHSDIVRQRFWLKLYRPFLQKFLRRADSIIVTSQDLLDSSLFLRGVEEKCRVVPLGIDIAEFEARKAARVEFSNPENKKIVLFVGRLVYYKGSEYVIEAMQRVDALLLVVGEGPLRTQLEVRAKQLELADKIVFLGQLSDAQLKYCYEVCDVFVLPSVERAEAFGLVQVEAMLAGKPVINTALSTGVPFVSKDGETGITVPPRDAPAFAKALNQLLGNESLRKRMGKAGRERAQKHFSLESMLAKTEQVYLDSLRL